MLSTENPLLPKSVYMQSVKTVKQLGPVMQSRYSWIYGSNAFPVVVKPQNLAFYFKFDIESQGQLPPPPPKKKKKLNKQ